MAKKNMTIEERIEKATIAVEKNSAAVAKAKAAVDKTAAAAAKAKEKYNKAKGAYDESVNKLNDVKNEQQAEAKKKLEQENVTKLLNAFANSGLSVEEIIALMQAKGKNE